MVQVRDGNLEKKRTLKKRRPSPDQPSSALKIYGRPRSAAAIRREDLTMACAKTSAAAIRRAIQLAASSGAVRRSVTSKHGQQHLHTARTFNGRQRMNNRLDLRPSAKKVDKLLDNLAETDISSMRKEMLDQTIKSMDLARRDTLSHNAKRSWAITGIVTAGFTFGTISGMEPAARKESVVLTAVRRNGRW